MLQYLLSSILKFLNDIHGEIVSWESKEEFKVEDFFKKKKTVDKSKCHRIKEISIT